MTDSAGEFTTVRRRRDAGRGSVVQRRVHRTPWDGPQNQQRGSRSPDAVVASIDDTLRLAPATIDPLPDREVLRPADVERLGTGRTATFRARLRAAAKRCFDVMLSFVLLVTLLPVFLTIMLAIRVTSSGPVFFRHERLGRDGVHFRCWKFRTMYEDADQRLQGMLARDSELRDEFIATRKLRRDPRITSVGRLLRRTSLDELPQLMNVLTGDMSIVGPRPIVDDETAMYGSSLTAVHGVRPGMTGLWQVSGRNDLPYDVRVRLDEQYARNQTLGGDLKILARTASVVVRGRGAY